MTNYKSQQSVCFIQPLRAIVATVILLFMSNLVHAQHQEMLVRISEIEIHPEHLDAYKIILNEEAEASVRLEPGVIAIFPVFQKDDATQVRILEIYQDQEAYQSHLKTEHFLKYKTTTLHMVKSLKLVDMDALDPETMPLIFEKMSSKQK